MSLFAKPGAGDAKLVLTKTHDFCASDKPILTVIFIHGIASSSTSYQNAIKYLEGTTSLKNVRFVAFDLLGSGKSYTSDKLNYDYRDQIIALHNAILKLNLKTPLVLIGHSMGVLIAIRYADTYKKSVEHLILISPPIFTPEDLNNPDFVTAMTDFKKMAISKNKKYSHNKAFDNEMKKIVLNKYNYEHLVKLTTHATFVYSNEDGLIIPSNVLKVVQANSKYLKCIKTIGTHKVARDKYTKIPAILEEVIND